MRIRDLTARLPELVHLPNRAAESWRAAADVQVRGVTADSRQATHGMLFVALPGARADGRAFIADAVARGAAAVLAPEGTAWPAGLPPRPLIEDPQPRRRLAQIAALFAGPQPMTVVAVTGTNGKTSTVEFLRQIWTAAGRTAGSVGTLGIHAPGFPPGEGLTTPDPVALANTMAALARAGVSRVAIEASSHGLPGRSPTSPATIWTTTAGWTPIAVRSCGCSANCCRRARRWWRAPRWTATAWPPCATWRASAAFGCGWWARTPTRRRPIRG
jgi:UDP-N-acetylmuramoyl-L-alanyl-D-glutamate--2,6-diaminopimelate ligase